ncbi:MAG TPA: cytochrome P450 [Acidimicrobiales bacterium]|nr:cytochrome P450 [Acidimicrobiales bacterium]
MSVQQTDVYYDPYHVEINTDPYPVYRRLRDEAPVYFNEAHGFYAISRHSDVERGLADKETFSNARSDVLEFIQAGVEFPPGIFIFEDPPLHTVHRGLISRVFTPRKMAAIEPQVRAYCVSALERVAGRDGWDFVKDLGAEMPMRVIGMLLGIPEGDQAAIRDYVDSNITTDPGQPMTDLSGLAGDIFADYLDWRRENPSDDLMTDLLQVEFEDHTGTRRRLEREEILTYISIVAGAGNETTTKLIGWTGKLLSDHPDQRRQLVADPGLIPGAIEEVLRFEPPGPHVARYVMRDTVLHGRTIPAGSPLLCLVGSANRDERRWDDPERFDIGRSAAGHLTFSFGIHFCLGASLARLEGRVALEEVLKRYPDWTVDEANAKLAFSSTVRGWESLPVRVGG